MNKLLFPMFALCLSCTAHSAPPLGMNIYGFSKHYGGDRRYNETNYGLGISALLTDADDRRLMLDAGAYYDSKENAAVMLLAANQWYVTDRFLAGVTAGVVKSRSYNDGEFTAVVLPLLTYRLTATVEMSMLYAPKIFEKPKVGVTAFYFTYRP